MNTRKLISLALAASMLIMTSACAGTQIPLNTTNNLRHLTEENPYVHIYDVTFATDQEYRVKDGDIVVHGDQIGIRFRKDEDFRYYRREQIKSIAVKKKRYAGIGAAIGAGVGLAASGIAWGVTGHDCGNASDKGDCEAIGTISGIAAIVLSGAVGAGIGAGIGGAIVKKKKPLKINISPKVYGLEHNEVSGAGIGISGQF